MKFSTQHGGGWHPRNASAPWRTTLPAESEWVPGSAPEMATPARRHIPSTLRRLGYWRSRQILACLRQFRDLAIRFDRWASLLLGPLDCQITPAQRHPTEMEREFNQLATRVARYMDMVGVSHGMTLVSGGAEVGDRRIPLDLLADFMTFPERHREQRLEALILRLDLAIGAYQEHQRNAIRRWVNPLFWIATAIVSAVSILEFAGLMSSREKQLAPIYSYGWGIRIAFLLVCLSLLLAQ